MIKKCYIYTRVSTIMQVDGYSLEAQKEKLKKYADAFDMKVVKEYSDEGKSGKNVDGRPQFKQMLMDIENQVDNVDYVLVFKLSRFGRNAADVLSSLQLMQDYGVNLICVEDGIDSSKDSGKLMISVLSAVSEIERDNILVQTMEGRRQKAREGKWNGGMAPYGYCINKGILEIIPEEAEIVKLIYDKYINFDMGSEKIAIFLNENGYRKRTHLNNKMDTFTSNFITKLIDNPVYYGKIAYGRRTNSKIKGTRNQYHKIKSEEYMICDGKHEAIISEEIWLKAQVKRKDTSTWKPKKHSLDHEHILSGLLKCPICGGSMYGNVNRKKSKKNPELYYTDNFYYKCKHRPYLDGKLCTYNRQWNQKLIDSAVVEIIRGLVKDKRFAIKAKSLIENKVDIDALNQEVLNKKKNLNNVIMLKDRLSREIDKLDYDDRHYERKYQDMQNRLSSFYDEIELIEKEIEDLEVKISNIKLDKVTTDEIYRCLCCFDKLYDKISDMERKTFMNRFIKEIQVFPERQEDRRIIKSIKFRFPIYYNGEIRNSIEWDSNNTFETVVSMIRKRVNEE